jgi:tetratricopeptide (TPR) repeat protein
MKSFLTRVIILSFLLIFITINPLQAATERRLALVIGNGKYTSSPLRNPVNDATDMADTLRKLGFNVILKINASKREMGKAVEDFEKQLKGQDVGLFYYAGHGVQVNGVNYLIPVSAKINEETDMEYEAIDAGRVLATMHNAKSMVNIVILDACRDNPYVRSFRSATRGLAIISKAPMGTIVSYSTSPGDVALDGKGRNSPYTSSLLQYMRQPGLSIEQVFKNVRQKLNRETSGKQVPWELSSLQGDFYFSTAKGSATRPSSEETSQVAMLTPTPESITDSTVQNDKYFALLARNSWNDALNYFQKAVVSSPDDMDARAGLAIALVFKGDESTAKYNIHRIKEVNYESRWTRVAIGLIEGMGQDYESGYYQLNRAIEEGADNALVRLCLVIINEKRGNYDLAEKEVNNYEVLVPAEQRGQLFKELAEKVNIGRLVGTYCYSISGDSGSGCRYRISFKIIGNDLAGSVPSFNIPKACTQLVTISNLKIKNNELFFRLRSQCAEYWSEYEVLGYLKGGPHKIPMTQKFVNGNTTDYGSKNGLLTRITGN